MFPTAAIALGTLLYSAPDPALEGQVAEILDEWCTACHSGGQDPALNVEPSSLLALTSIETGKPLVVPQDPAGSYLMAKMTDPDGIAGEVMPPGETVPPEQLAVITEWIDSLPVETGPPPTPPPKPPPKPFHGTSQITLPTTTTLGKRTLQYRIDHRFGRIGTERGAFGLDAGVSMAMGLQYGIIDGLDVQLRRSNSRKTWELGTKYVPLRQEEGRPLSFGGYAALSLLRDFDVSNPWVGDFQLMVSRLWFERWSTMLTMGYHLNTNHNSRVVVDFGDGVAVPVRDKRDTMTMGLASTVWLGKRRRWGIDMEYVLPIPDGSTPNVFFYRGGDADPNGFSAGSWSLGGSLRTAKHFFQVFFSNNREISTNLAATGGQSGNPFDTQGVDSNNPFHKFNFFLGFNLGRQFGIKGPKRKAKASAEVEQ